MNIDAFLKVVLYRSQTFGGGVFGVRRDPIYFSKNSDIGKEIANEEFGTVNLLAGQKLIHHFFTIWYMSYLARH